MRPDDLLPLFAKVSLPAEVDEYDIVIIDIGLLHIWISARPWYCDRGRWQVNIESRDSTKLTIDHQDGFPRYYFTAEAMVTEVVEFIKARSKENTT